MWVIVSAAPVQVVVTGALAAIVRLSGSVTLRLDCVSAKPLLLLRFSISVETVLVAMAAGANAAKTVGGTGATCNPVGQAPALPPAAGAAVLVAVVAVKVTVSTSTWPAESVSVSVKVPPSPGLTVTFALSAPPSMMAAGVALQ